MTKSPKKDIIWDNVWFLGRKHILAIRRKEINPQKHVVPFWDFEAYMSVSALWKLPVFPIPASKLSKVASLS